MNEPTATATRRLLDLAKIAADNADATTLDFARFCLEDWLGVTVAGAQENVVNVVADTAAPVDPSSALPLIGRSGRAALVDAALINGVAGHALDYDDGHSSYMGHPSVAILPGLWALAHTREGVGDRFLRAIVAAVEAGGRGGMMIAPDHYRRGFHGTGTTGALAAAVGAAYLLDLDDETTERAVGLAVTRAAGLKASFGTDGKPLHAGWAAVVALTAVRWAEAGMTAQRDIIGHSQGYVAALTDTGDPEKGLQSGTAPQILEVSYKRHAACGVTHGAIDAVAQLQSASGFGPDDVESIIVHIGKEADDICNIQDPKTGLQMKFSLRAVTSMVAAGIDTSDIGSFTDEGAGDPRLRSMMDRVTVDLKDDWDLRQSHVDIALKDGRKVDGAATIGEDDRDPERLKTSLAKKFRSLAEPKLGGSAVDAILEAIWSAPGPDVRELARITALPAHAVA